MKMALYILLLAAEAFTGFLALGLMYSNLGWVSCAVTLAVMAALLVMLIIKLKKKTDAAERKKALRNIALVMLIPTAAGLIGAAYLLISMMIYFG